MDLKNTIFAIYALFNEMLDPSSSSRLSADLTLYFSNDFVVLSNRSLNCQGHQGLRDHFQEVIDAGLFLQAKPFDELVIDNLQNKIALKFDLVQREASGEKPFKSILALWSFNNQGQAVKLDQFYLEFDD